MTENFYFDDPEEGTERYSTLEAAKKAAGAALEILRDDASGNGWHENIERLEYGIMVPVGTVQQTRYKETPESTEHEYTCDYELVAAPGAPTSHQALIIGLVLQALHKFERETVQARVAGHRMMFSTRTRLKELLAAEVYERLMNQ